MAFRHQYQIQDGDEGERLDNQIAPREIHGVPL